MEFNPSALAAAVTNPYSMSGGDDSAVAESAGKFIGLLSSVTLGLAIFGVFILLAWFARSRLQKSLYKRYGERHQQTILLYGRILFSAIFITGAFVALSVVGGASLEWFTGALGLGIAFALRGIISQFFAGLLVLSGDKFNLGDYITFDNGTAGTIVDIQARATTLRAFDGAQITVPNNDLISKNVTCYTRNPIRRHELKIGVGYGTNLKQASEIILNAVRSHAAVQPEPAPATLISEIGDSAVNISVRFWTESKSKWWLAKSEILSSVFEALQSSGVDIPYPVRTLRVDSDSSAILADHPDFLNKLETIEHKKELFKPAPVEGSTAPAATSVAPIASQIQTSPSTQQIQQ